MWAVGSSQAAWVPGRVQRVLRDTYGRQLSILVLLVYLNLVRIRLLQYLSTEEILP